MTLLTARHADQIRGVLECFDRIVIQGMLLGLCYAEGMTTYLRVHQIRIFDYPGVAEPLRDQIRQNAERLAAANGLTIEFLRRADMLKEDRVAAMANLQLPSLDCTKLLSTKNERKHRRQSRREARVHAIAETL
ncbi:MAG: hypothetical protein L0387_04560 [Acidobacteria bacterium]|nr:hypothetical protein [Acidobacteriota bacterium]MCI0620934.1 hypothetical protein [Acidobacteriota bacterium]MCI0720626.1 hypothetical protein [Acidobacteriota bacterium]